MHNYQKLELWREAVELSIDVYKITSRFPESERYNLISQLQRSAVSIPSNIAEGAGRNSNNEFKHFLAIANGSAYELETQLIIASRLGYVGQDQVADIGNRIGSVQRMLYSLQQSLKN